MSPQDSTTAAQRPIGFWLRRLDELITEHSSRALSELGLTRFHWQVMNLIQEQDGASRTALLDTLKDFIDAPRLDEILAELAHRGWIESPMAADSIRLTASGVTAHQEVLTVQTEVRNLVAQGISMEDYATTLRVLQRMVENLEAAHPLHGQS